MGRSRPCASRCSARWSRRRWTRWTCRCPAASACAVTATCVPSTRDARRTTRVDRCCLHRRPGPPPPYGPSRVAQVSACVCMLLVCVYVLDSVSSAHPFSHIRFQKNRCNCATPRTRADATHSRTHAHTHTHVCLSLSGPFSRPVAAYGDNCVFSFEEVSLHVYMDANVATRLTVVKHVYTELHK